MLSFPDALLLIGAGVSAGAINAVAGGGSLVTFPALVAVGYPPVTANVTNTVAVWPGYLSGTATFRPELAGQGRRLRHLAPVVVAGAVAGSILLLVLPDAVFDVVVPWLVLAAAGLLAIQPRLARAIRARREPVHGHGAGLGLQACLFAASAYGAYFGGGVGVVLLAVLGLFLEEGLHRLNGLKSALTLGINTIALVAFVAFGDVAWEAVAVVAPAALVGGTVGARLARRLPAVALRTAIVVVGLVVGVVMLVR